VRPLKFKGSLFEPETRYSLLTCLVAPRYVVSARVFIFDIVS